MAIRFAAVTVFLVVSTPLAVNASTANANFITSFSIEITAPGVTSSVDEDFGLSLREMSAGTGVVAGSVFPDPFSISDPTTVTGILSGSAAATSPFGFADVLSNPFLNAELSNETSTDVVGTINWNLSSTAVSNFTGGNSEARAFAAVFFELAIPQGDTIFAEVQSFPFPEPSLNFASEIDQAVGIGTFTIPAGETAFLSVLADGNAHAAVIPVLPAIAYGFTGLLALQTLRMRRRG